MHIEKEPSISYRQFPRWDSDVNIPHSTEIQAVTNASDTVWCDLHISMMVWLEMSLVKEGQRRQR